jgi:hypothetical protein
VDIHITIDPNVISAWLSGDVANRKLDDILARLDKFIGQETTMNADTQAAIAEMTTEVTAAKTVGAGAIALLNGLSAKLAAIGTAAEDPAIKTQILDLASGLKTENAAIAAALVANTPAAPST